MWGRETNRKASGDVSTCSLLEQRPGGSGGILISSGDMFLTFSENKAARETENMMVRRLIPTGAAFPFCSGLQALARWNSPDHFNGSLLCTSILLMRTKMCLEPIIELPRNNTIFVCFMCPALLMHTAVECGPFRLWHGAFDMVPAWDLA